MLLFLSSLVWADIFGLNLEQVRFDIDKGRYSKAIKLLRTLEKDALQYDEILTANEIAALWYLRGVIEHRKRREVIDWWRKALTMNPHYPWEPKLINDPLMRDLFYTIQQEMLYRDTRTAFIPPQYGTAELYVDGRKQHPHSEVLDGWHFLQIKCPNGDIYGKWDSLGTDPNWLSMCPEPFETNSSEGTADGQISMPVFGLPDELKKRESERTSLQKSKEDGALRTTSQQETNAVQYIWRSTAHKRMHKVQLQAQRDWIQTKKRVQRGKKSGKQALNSFIEAYDNQTVLVTETQLSVPIPEVGQAKSFANLLKQGKRPHKAFPAQPLIVSSIGTLVSGYFLYSALAIDRRLMKDLDAQTILLSEAKAKQQDANLRYAIGYGGMALSIGYGSQAFLSHRGFHFGYQSRW